jgi:type IV pilus assembly protein PilF
MTNRFVCRFVAALGLSLLLAACGGKKAIQADNEALGLNPEDSPAELYVRMAEEYYSRGQTEIAFRRAMQAIEADNSYPRAHVWLAFLYEEIGQADKARQHYDQALELAPNNADVLYAYGSFQCRQKRYAEADAQFAKALANPLYATPWIAMTNAGNCAASAGNASKAETYYRNAINASPTFGPALVKLAEIAYQRGDTKTAKGYLDRYFEPATTRTPSTSYSALTIGTQIERKLGNRKRADEYERALKTNFPQAPKPREL